ncbi:hypothetical protein MUG87_17330 [Ectobacillus sp. JY-23]|uniref:hypothetical protein n=1 Tax=Ectobacillus sp. JY-23 TaxID=2933872 RepID=UPI001FF3C401|nr:hypothetical protein [Ectobacillus sp. JY-23]UOY92175.1 hypothetical protein MUG87_17330 [Ectobacillus sp. JY-23]
MCNCFGGNGNLPVKAVACNLPTFPEGGSEITPVTALQDGSFPQLLSGLDLAGGATSSPVLFTRLLSSGAGAAPAFEFGAAPATTSDTTPAAALGTGMFEIPAAAPTIITAPNSMLGVPAGSFTGLRINRSKTYNITAGISLLGVSGFFGDLPTPGTGDTSFDAGDFNVQLLRFPGGNPVTSTGLPEVFGLVPLSTLLDTSSVPGLFAPIPMVRGTAVVSKRLFAGDIIELRLVLSPTSDLVSTDMIAVAYAMLRLEA